MARKVGQTVEWGSMAKRGSGKRNDGAQTGNAGVSPSRWWTLRDDQVAGSIVSLVQHIKASQYSMELLRQVCARLYGGLLPGGAYGLTTDKTQLLNPAVNGRLTYNLVAVVVDSLASKIASQPVRPMFLTDGGDYHLQRRAKLLTQFSDGILYEQRMSERGPRAFLDAAILGDGIIHVFEDPATRRLAFERVLPFELYVDTVDGLYGEPRQMTRVTDVDREMAVAAYGTTPELRDMIRRCPASSTDLGRATLQAATDSIPIAESWHLASGPETPDGQRVITCERGVLAREEWNKSRFPFARLSWKPRLYGWHGASLVEDLIGTQIELNKLLALIQKSFQLMGGFKILVEQGTIPSSHFQDKLGTILQVPRGAMSPQYLTPPPISVQYFNHFESVKARGFEIARLSQMSAVGERPAGLDSGEAQRVYHDIEGEGFQSIGKRYEQFHLDAITLAIDVVRDIFERDGKYGVRAPSTGRISGARFVRSLDWSQVDLAEDVYELRPTPTSALPATMAGRLSAVEDLARAGYIDAATARKLLDFPDINQVETLLGASEAWVTRVLDGIVEEGTYEPPDPYMDLNLAKTLLAQEYALGAAHGLEPERLLMLRDWDSQLDALIAQGQAPASPPPGPGPGPGPQPGKGVPMAPPQSPLLPPPGTVPMATA